MSPSRAPRGLGVLLALALAASTAGCADAQERYCDTVADQQDRLSEIAGSGDALALFEAREVYAALAADAPDDIADEWRLVLDRIDALERALDEAGADPEAYDPEDPPAGVDAREQARIRQAAEDLVDLDVVSAMGDLEQQALDVCGTPLRL